ncbi:MAG: hypothetical protein QXI11_06855, partial [Thermoproteota archaeon]
NSSIDNNTLILVEGVTDLRALQEAGINAKIFTLFDFYKWMDSEQHGKAFRVIAMLDLDREGESTLRKLKNKYSNIVNFDELPRKKLRMTNRYKKGLRTIYQLFNVSNKGNEYV